MQRKLIFLLIILPGSLAACDGSSFEAPEVTGEWVGRLEFVADTTFRQVLGPAVRYQVLVTHTYRLSLDERDGTVTGQLHIERIDERARTETGGPPEVTIAHEQQAHTIAGSYEQFRLQFGGVGTDTLYVPGVFQAVGFDVFEGLIIERGYPSRSSLFLEAEGRVEARTEEKLAFRRP